MHFYSSLTGWITECVCVCVRVDRLGSSFLFALLMPEEFIFLLW